MDFITWTPSSLSRASSHHGHTPPLCSSMAFSTQAFAFCMVRRWFLRVFLPMASAHPSFVLPASCHRFSPCVWLLCAVLPAFWCCFCSGFIDWLLPPPPLCMASFNNSTAPARLRQPGFPSPWRYIHGVTITTARPGFHQPASAASPSHLLRLASTSSVFIIYILCFVR